MKISFFSGHCFIILGHIQKNKKIKGWPQDWAARVKLLFFFLGCILFRWSNLLQSGVFKWTLSGLQWVSFGRPVTAYHVETCKTQWQSEKYKRVVGEEKKKKGSLVFFFFLLRESHIIAQLYSEIGILTHGLCRGRVPECMCVRARVRVAF